MSTPTVSTPLLSTTTTTPTPQPTQLPPPPPQQQQPPPDPFRQQRENVDVTAGSLCFLLLITIVCILAFSILHHCLRQTIKHVFAARCKASRPVFPEPDRWPLAWMKSVYEMKEDAMVKQNGLDAVVYLRFLRMAFKLTLFCAIGVPVVIVPLNTVGIVESELGLNMYSISNLPVDSDRTWGHLIFTYIVSAISMKLFYDEYANYTKLRQEYFVSPSIESRTVLIRDLPPRLQHNDALETFVNELNIGPVEAVHVAHRYSGKPKKVVKQRLAALRELEKEFIWIGQRLCKRAEKLYKKIQTVPNGYELVTAREKALLELNSEFANKQISEMNIWRLIFFDPEIQQLIETEYTRRIRVRWLPWKRTTVSVLEHYTSEFCRLDNEVRAIHELWKNEETSDAIVVFKTHRAAQIACQSIVTPEPFSCIVSMAPEPRSVLWTSLGCSHYALEMRKFWSTVAMGATTFLWLVPFLPVAALINIDSLKVYWPSLEIVTQENPLMKSLFQVLPILLLQSIMSILPMFLDVITRLERPESRGILESNISSKVFFFLVFNVLLVVSVGTSIARTVAEVLDNPSTFVIAFFADQLPKNAVFYSNYILLSTIFSALYILNYNSLFFNVLMARLVSSTPRDLWTWHIPLPPCYYYLYPYHMLVLAITLTYSIIYPFILFFAVFYFAINYVVQANNFMYVYKARYEGGGRIWTMVFDRLITGLLIFQVTMIAIFVLRKDYVQGGMEVILFASTIRFRFFCEEAFKRSSENLPLSVLSELDKKEETSTLAPPSSPISPGTPNSAAALQSPFLLVLPEHQYRNRTGTVESFNYDKPVPSSEWTCDSDEEDDEDPQRYRPTALTKRLPMRLWLPRDPTQRWTLELKSTVRLKISPEQIFAKKRSESQEGIVLEEVSHGGWEMRSGTPRSAQRAAFTFDDVEEVVENSREDLLPR